MGRARVLAMVVLATGAWAAPAQRTVIVKLRSQAKLAGGSEVVARLGAHARASQRALEPLLKERRAQGQLTRVERFWIFNGMAVTATDEVIEELARLPEVASISPDELFLVPAAAPPGPNLVSVRVPPLWDAGVDGRGAVIASLDTGVDVSHPDLASRFRAGGWFDPYGQHATPIDLVGHGTWTMGVMLGGEAGGTAIGVAPGARWIAAKIFDDRGAATATAIHLAFQWVLDPDGDPATADAPDVVNGSWSFGAPGCNLEFEPDLQALRAAGIVSVFAAGNSGPGALTSTSPGNYPGVFSVGSVDGAGAIAWDSSRGPSACDGSTFPDVVAPGVDIVTTELFSLYTRVSGTSVSTPHVSGLFALLAGAFPQASVAELEAALTAAATDLGPVGPDDTFGAGQVDALAAYQRLASAAAPPLPPPPPTALDDAFSLAEDTAAAFSRPGVLANDKLHAGGPLSAVLVGEPAHGVLSLQPNGSLSYTPAPDFFGVDFFTYVASDGVRSGPPATVALNVTPVNDPPIAVEDRATFSRLAPVKLDLLANDFDVDGRLVPGTVELLTPPRKGSVTIGPNGAAVYTPRRGFTGTDLFTYAVWDDGGARSNPASVRLERR